ncbi:MAG: hypothetical protein QOI47_1204, partial [Actinomycetota bacterium]|nr:hypothetical protein [Actinomycetota bacterium]
MLFDEDDRATAGAPPEGRPERRVARWLTVVGILVAVVLVAVAGGGLWVKGKIDPSGPPGARIAFEIPRGATSSAVADLLARKHVVTSAEVFRWYLRVKGGGPFEAGIYHLRLRSAMGVVITALEKGPDLPPTERLTIPEGLWVSEIAKRVDRLAKLDGAKFLELVRSGTIRSIFQPPGQTSMEGVLFPDTYQVGDTENETHVLQRMVDTFDEVATQIGYADARAKVGVSPYEAIIVASLVESEAKVDEDRAKIARVIYNRLQKHIPLGIDATFYYVLGESRKGTGLRQSDLAMDSPYNTRKNAGLVPTPIAVPGRASLEAALNPEPGPWLYYVIADKQGRHTFT